MSEIKNLQEIMTVEELADYLRISRAKAYELVHQKGFPSLFIGRTIRIRRSELEKWIKEKGKPKSNIPF